MAQVCTLRSKSGDIKTLVMTPVTLHDEGGNSQLLCFFLDITQHRKVELALGEREQRYRELLAAVTNYTYSVKLENGLPVATDHSWGCLSVTGYMPEDYRVRSLFVDTDGSSRRPGDGAAIRGSSPAR